MFDYLMSVLLRRPLWLEHERPEAREASRETTPLDQVERLQRNGVTLPVMLEFTRVGW